MRLRESGVSRTSHHAQLVMISPSLAWIDLVIMKAEETLGAAVW
jgi:hypothetical protein